MKRYATLGSAVAVLAAVGMATPAEAACKKRLVALLSGMQETPPVSSPAIGCGVFEIDTDANTVTYRIVVSGLTSPEMAAHIHGPADPGVPAGVKHPLPAGSVKTGVWNYAEADEASILAGKMYVNVHTANFGGGEVRGQMVTAVCDLDAGQEVPPNPSPARGFGVFMVNPQTNTLAYYIAYGGLTSAETAAHIHGMASIGSPAGVLHPLPAGNPKVGVWNYTDAQEPGILNGLTYVNIHTANFGGGEIRGQITPHVMPIDGLQEVPPTPSSGAGVSLMSMDTANNVLGFDVRFTNMLAAETAAHIHGMAMPGVNAGVLFGLPLGARKLGTWNFAAVQKPDILKGLTYVNIHSGAFGGGELRGQNQFAKLPCPGDIDGDGTVGQPDLGILLAAYGTSSGQAGYTLCADLDGDGAIGQPDLGLLLGNYNAICP